MKRLWLMFGCVWLLAGCATSPSAPVEPAMQSDPARFVVVTLRNDTAPSIPRAGSTVRGYEPPPSYSLAPATRASAQGVASTFGLREIAAWPIGLLGIQPRLTDGQKHGDAERRDAEEHAGRLHGCSSLRRPQYRSKSARPRPPPPSGA